jgi:hypothetical protein
MTTQTMKPWFVIYYECPCGCTWQDEWDCACDDDCPECGTTCQAADFDEIGEVPEDYEP